MHKLYKIQKRFSHRTRGIYQKTNPTSKHRCRSLLREDSSEKANDGTDVTEEQEPTLYAGKYKSVDLFLYENCTVHNIINLFLIDI